MNVVLDLSINLGQIVQAVVSLIGAGFAGAAFLRSRSNGKELKEVKHLTNSLSEKAQSLSYGKGAAEGELKGRSDQTEERRVETAQAVADRLKP